MDYRIAAYTLTDATGPGIQTTRDAIRDRISGLRENDFESSTLETWIGRCVSVDGFEWDEIEAPFRSRNNAMAAMGLGQDEFLEQVDRLADIVGRHRIGVIIGTSTSSIGQTEEAYRSLTDGRMASEHRQPRVHNPHSPADFVAHRCQLTGPVMTISTACSSSAKVFASGARWLDLGLVDAIVVGGVDSLCLSVLHGFNSLELTSRMPCRPFDIGRDGISIGEAAGFALLTPPDHAAEADIRLSGYGESSDAYHMSHPHPEGLGARLAMEAAMKRADLTCPDIDYINLHGTASQANDRVEARAVKDLFDQPVAASSTKGWTGHALGAAGIVEALIALDTLKTGLLPGTLNLETPDPTMAFPILSENQTSSPRHVMTNSFGFGGNNCCLVFSGDRR